ncbi:hypothetical protein CN902_26620 [Priestia megaterium]|nr:hypothetical protein CN902_26620 [Priestia megaterium]
MKAINFHHFSYKINTNGRKNIYFIERQFMKLEFTNFYCKIKIINRKEKEFINSKKIAFYNT